MQIASFVKGISISICASKYTIQALPPIFLSVGLSIGYEIFSARQPMVRSIPGHSQPDVSVSYWLPVFYSFSKEGKKNY